MTRTPHITAVAAALLLGACDNSDHTIVAGPNADEPPVVTENVTLPPAIAASKIYRCKDNSVVYIDWLADNKSANFRADTGATPVNLQAPEAGQPMVAEGYSLTGTAADASVTLTRPEMGAQSCKA